MDNSYKIAVFEGDGIGPEITAPTLEILDALQGNNSDYSLEFVHTPAGATHYQKTGEALPDTSIQTASKCDAILLSAMGLPNVRYEDGTEISPQIDLRMEFDLYAGVRPVVVRDSENCPLKRPNGETIDFVLVRESTEGLFYTQGKGEVMENEARETLRITKQVSEKLFNFTFKLAEQRKAAGLSEGTVTCVDKANVFRAFAFFREIFDQTASGFPDIKTNHAYVDATALWMVQKPWIFDVMVTENMFGDILSDLGAGLMGGLGLAPSADIGDKHAVFQPCHGSAPDIAGENIANPMAMILSAGMMLDWLGQNTSNETMIADAIRIREAVDYILSEGKYLTRDINGQTSTSDCAKAVMNRLSG